MSEPDLSMFDLFREEAVASAQKWEMSPAGQHIELGIAENNLFLLLAALGLALGTAHVVHAQGVHRRVRRERIEAAHRPRVPRVEGSNQIHQFFVAGDAFEALLGIVAGAVQIDRGANQRRAADGRRRMSAMLL